MIAKSYPFGMKNDHIRMLFLLINMRTYMFMVISFSRYDTRGQI